MGSSTAAYCAKRFGTKPDADVLPSRFGFKEPADLSKVTSRIVFTNGLRDGWSTGGILSSPSAELPALIMPNGAHHSEMTLPSADDTKDVVATRRAMEMHLREWLASSTGKSDRVDQDK